MTWATVTILVDMPTHGAGGVFSSEDTPIPASSRNENMKEMIANDLEDRLREYNPTILSVQLKRKAY